MPRLVLVLSGPIGSGKSTLAADFSGRFGALIFETRAYLRAHGAGVVRSGQQELGEQLDQAGGRWVADGLGEWLEKHSVSADALVVVDSVRREAQVDGLRAAFGDTRVVHLHLSADDGVLERRYQTRATRREGEPDFATARAHPTEARVGELARGADIVIDDSRMDAEDVATIAFHRLGLYARSAERLVDVLIGGQYGSEGKGNIASYLAREYGLLVRVGGPNAGHKVLSEAIRGGHPDRAQEEGAGEVYTHHSLPSGTRTSAARLLIGPGAVLNLEKFLKEVHDCAVDVDRLAVDPQVMLIDREVDPPAEAALFERIGSTMQGVGAAAARRIMERGLPSVRFAAEIPELRPYTRRWAVDVLEETFRRGELVMLEGTQGTGLSIWHGAYPWVTSRDATVAGCCAEAGISPSRVRKVVMTSRTYPIRVQSPPSGWSGPMRWRPPVTPPNEATTLADGEITWEEIERRSGIGLPELLQTEQTSTTKRQRRVGEFDWAWLHRASQLNRPTDIALTFADYLGAANKKARRYDQLSEQTHRLVEQVEAVAGAPVSLISTGLGRNRIIDRRRW